MLPVAQSVMHFQQVGLVIEIFIARAIADIRV